MSCLKIDTTLQMSKGLFLVEYDIIVHDPFKYLLALKGSSLSTLFVLSLLLSSQVHDSCNIYPVRPVEAKFHGVIFTCTLVFHVREQN
jgi:hypothetical protein